MPFKWLLILLLAVFLAAVPAAGQAAPAMVEKTAVQVEALAGRLPPLIQKRMQASVQSLADQLLTGQRIERIADGRSQYEDIIHDVFDKILVGYSVAKVTIVPAETLQLFVQLVPWAETIQGVTVEIDVEGMPPEIAALAKQDLSGVAAVFEQSLVGLPVDATDWTNGVLKSSLNDFMEKQLPEFRADFDMDTGLETTVKLTVYPKGPVIRNIDLSMRSDTMPNILLLNYRPLLQKRADIMLGVPIAFVNRHQEYFRQMMKESLDTTADCKKFKMHTAIDLQPGARTVIMSRSDTAKYRLRFEDRLDMGRSGDKDESASFHAYAGMFISPKDELFVQTEFYPQDVRFIWYGGYARVFAEDAEVFVKYDTNTRDFVLGAGKTFDQRWHLRYEYAQATGLGEIGVRYRLHDFVSLEYILQKDDSWLRLIGNF